MSEARYAKQQILREIGAEGQQGLADSAVLIVGYSALGCIHGELLARAGVGRMHIVDHDLVEFTNLPRQIAFDEQDARSQQAGRVMLSSLLLCFQTAEGEMAIFPDGRAIIMGTTDEAKARSFYAKYLGI